MNELIWVGNTLYPRWIVFSAIGAAPLALALLAAVVRFVWMKQQFRQRGDM